MTGTRVRQGLVIGFWLAGTLGLGLLGVLPVGFGATAVARLCDGQLDVHHAGTEVFGQASPYPVDNDEVPVSLMFGALGVGILAWPLLRLALVLRRSLPRGRRVTAGVFTATLLVALAPSAWMWHRLG